MKLLIVSQYFWPEEFRINEVAATLRQKGVEVEVLTGKPNYPQGEIFPGYRAWGCQRETHLGIGITRIPLFPRGRRAWRLAVNYLSFVGSGLLFAPLRLRGKKFAVIFVYAPSPILQAIPALFLGWLKGCPVVLWVQDLWPESLAATGHVRNRLLLGLVGQVVRFIYRQVDLLLVQSEGFIGPVEALASGTPVRYYPNSVDASFSRPALGAGPEIAGLAGGFSVLFAGNLGSAQAVEVIVEAATLLKGHAADLQFVVLGEGSRWEWLRREVEKRGLTNLHLPGRFPVETMPGLMQKASALLVTLADREIFRATIPSKVQAYLAAGRPILACLNGEGAKLVTTAGAGLAVPAEDAPALAAAILQLYHLSTSEREAMGARGRAYYEQHFAHEMLIEQLLDHLRSLGAPGEKSA
ncbi:MAG: glycosyltransferase family 4 protein [Desulfobulbaceae bacterium]|nr:glycosyltransferase family 4 protein [Desulfobulbaceae bacterium]